MIGIIGAMELEVKALREAMTEKREERVSGADFTVGKISGRDVCVVRSGIGKVAAGVIAEAMILRFSPEVIINTGVGGALAPDLRIGDVVVADRALQYDMDTSPIGDPVGYISGADRIYFDADPGTVEKLVAAAEKIGIPAKVATVATGDRFVAGREEKEKIRALFPTAAVCEMEGGAIAHTAFLNGTPFAVVRSVSDVADESSHMDYPTFAGLAAARSIDLLMAFIGA